VNVAQLRRFRLRELLLLALRVLAIALLSLALSRSPRSRVARAARGVDAASSVVLLIDRSASMGAIESRKPLSERARERARAVLDALEPGDEVQVVPFDARPEPLFPNADRSNRPRRGGVDAIEPRPFHDRSRGRDRAGRWTSCARRPQLNKELFLVSRSPGGGPAAGASDSARALPANVRFYVLPVGDDQHPENLALTGATVRGSGSAMPAGCRWPVPSAFTMRRPEAARRK
jgi:hypothetical protein